MKKLKYVDTATTFSEVPDEISLCINIAGCPFRCKGCHSPYLQKDEGEPLTTEALDDIISKNNGVTCVTFMGGDGNPYELMKLIHHVKMNHTGLKTCWYSGGDQTYHNLYIEGISHALLDYVKYGCYDEEQGPLDNPNTNQRFYTISWNNGMAQMECLNWWFQLKDKSNSKSA